ncbi:MAG: hypothetical protein R3F61_15815 [Myxococcota bacterium]
MQNFESYYYAVVEILRSVDEGAALALLGMSGEAELVTLLEGQTTVMEALSYARVMFEIGMDEVAHDVLREIMSAGMRVPELVPQGIAAIA